MVDGIPLVRLKSMGERGYERLREGLRLMGLVVLFGGGGV
jgi:hypothetical protein